MTHDEHNGCDARIAELKGWNKRKEGTDMRYRKNKTIMIMMIAGYTEVSERSLRGVNGVPSGHQDEQRNQRMSSRLVLACHTLSGWFFYSSSTTHPPHATVSLLLLLLFFYFHLSADQKWEERENGRQRKEELLQQESTSRCGKIGMISSSSLHLPSSCEVNGGEKRGWEDRREDGREKKKFIRIIRWGEREDRKKRGNP